MDIFSNRQVFIFDEKGTEYSRLDLPEMFYLETEDDYIRKMMKFSRLKGMAILIDWNAKTITSKRISQYE